MLLFFCFFVLFCFFLGGGGRGGSGFCQKPQKPLKTMKQLKRTTETKKGEYIFFILLKKGKILFRRALLFHVILNSIQSLIQRSNSQWPKL